MLGSPQDMIMIGLVGFLVFGGNKMPEIARTFGNSLVEFKRAMRAAAEPEKLASRDDGKAA